MSVLDILRDKTNPMLDPSQATEWTRKNLTWIPHEKDGFALATIIKQKSDGLVEVELLESSEKLIVSTDDCQTVNPPRFDKCDDMAGMSCLNEAAVLHNLKQRYFANLIYTYSGLFCVVINPYRRLGIYTDEIAEEYKGKKRSDLPPHIFAVADEAYRSMLQDREDQSILCTGESGAGKTENTKKVIQYLTMVAGTKRTMRYDLDSSHARLVAHLEDQLLQANPILEAFGNSKTVKNDNSSRFGKFIRIHFDGTGCISGANIEFYLLEKSRVLRQAPHERSFHIFYQLLSAASQKMREEFLLETAPASYSYLSNDNVKISGIDDKKEFADTVNAMEVMGFSSDEIHSIWRLLSSVLLLGNLEFAQDGRHSDQATISNDAVAQKIANLLGVNPTDFMRAFLKPKIKIQRDSVHRSQNEEQARFATSAIAKAIYERLFRWLVYRINRSLDRTRQHAVSFVGILDIAGFEIFDLNSFEQLCINYTNEKLQQLFNNTMFIKEQQEYLDEGLEWDMIDFGLNLQPTIDLIDKPGGVLSTLEDICLFPQGNDSQFVERLNNQHHNHPKYLVPEMRAKSDFVIVHYAGRVDYKASGWRVKNMDPLNDNVVELLQASKESLVFQIWKDVSDVCRMGATEVGDSGVFGARVKKGLFRTVSQVYKEQLSCLMTTLQNTNPHFVRCVIPNHDKRPDVLNSQLVLEQLRCNGVLEGIRICRQGFPNRLPFQEFRQRYEKLLAPDVNPNGFMDGKEAVRRIIAHLNLEPSLCRIGQSKVFFRTGVLAELESMRDEELLNTIVAFQSQVRGFLARKKMHRRHEQDSAIRILQRNGKAWARLREWQWWRLLTRVKPLLEVTNKDEIIAEREIALRDTNEKLRRSEVFITDMSAKLSKIEEERVQLQQRLDVESMERAEADEARARYATHKAELEEKLSAIENQLRHEEEARSAAEQERQRLTVNIRDLEGLLEEEEKERQTLFIEKNTTDKRIKALENELLEFQDDNGKVLKEKQVLEQRCQQLANQLVDEQEKTKSLTKVKSRAEAQLSELIEEQEKEKQLRSQLEAAKRSLDVELREEKEKATERSNKADELYRELQAKEAELINCATKLDEEIALRQQREREIREVNSKLDEALDDLSIEREERKKAEQARRNIFEELEGYKRELEETQDKSALNLELRTRKEKEFDKIRKELDDAKRHGDERFESQRQTYAKQIQELSDNLDNALRQKTSAEKSRTQLDAIRERLEQELANAQAARQEAERRRKNMELQLAEQQLRVAQMEEDVEQLSSKLIKATSELENMNRVRDSESDAHAAFLKKHVALETQVAELREANEADKLQRSNLQKKLRDADSELLDAETRESELVSANEKLKTEVANARTQLAEFKKKFDEEAIEKIEEARRQLKKDLSEAQSRIAELELAKDKGEQSKRKVQQELEDVSRELQLANSNMRDMERKQRKADQLLADEKAHTSAAEQAKESAQQQSRDYETKILQLTKELDAERSAKDVAEKERRILSLELDNLASNQDDAGKNVFELEKAKHRLEEELEEARAQVLELEDELTILEDNKTRLEVKFQAARQDWERSSSQRDIEEEEKRRNLQRQVRELDEELESERRQKAQAVSAKKQLESAATATEEQLDRLQRQLDGAQRDIRRLTQALKDANIEGTEARNTLEETLCSVRESEKRLRSKEAEVVQLMDSVHALTNARKKLELDRDELLEELEKIRSSTLGQEDRRRLEAKIADLEDDLEHESTSHDSTSEKLRQAQSQVEKLTTELTEERSVSERLEDEKRVLEKSVSEYQIRADTAEGEVATRYKVQLATLEATNRQLRDQIDDIERDKNNFERMTRRYERQIRDLTESREEEKRKGALDREQMEASSSRLRQIKRELNDREEELSKEHTKLRDLRRELDAARDENQSLTREINSLKSRVTMERRPTHLRSSRQFGSSNSLAHFSRTSDEPRTPPVDEARSSSRQTGSNLAPSDGDADSLAWQHN